MDNVLIFAGTTEGRILAGELEKSGCHVMVSVATDYGREILNPGKNIQVHTGRMDGQEMAEFLIKNQIDLVIDATHPYAKEVTRQIELACKRTNTEKIRCLRSEELLTEQEREELEPWMIHVSSAGEAAKWLDDRSGNILLCTGSKELPIFSGISDFENRIYARILPVVPVLEACKKLGLKGRHIIAVQGPFSVEMNLAMIKEYNCRFLVTKDGGKEGGYLEKVRAAAMAEIPVLVIDRPKEEAGMSADEVIQWYERRKKQQIL